MTWNGRVHQFLRMLGLASVQSRLSLVDLDFLKCGQLGSCCGAAADAIEADWEMDRNNLEVVLGRLMDCLGLGEESRGRFCRYVETQLDRGAAWQAVVAWSDGFWVIAYRQSAEASRALDDDLRERAASLIRVDLPADRWWDLLNGFEADLASDERENGMFLSYLIRRRAVERIWSSLKRDLSDDEREVVRRAVEIEAFRVNALRQAFDGYLPQISDAVPLLAAK